MELFWEFFLSLAGRLNRVQFLSRFVLVTVVCLLALVVGYEAFQMARSDSSQAASPYALPTGFVALILLLLSLWGQVSITVRRLHDMGLSGKWALPYFVTLIALTSFGHASGPHGVTAPSGSDVHLDVSSLFGALLFGPTFDGEPAIYAGAVYWLLALTPFLYPGTPETNAYDEVPA